MTALEAVLRRMVADLTQTGHAFALVGGLAVSVRTEPRFTRDADLAVAVGDDAEAESLVQVLRHRGFRDTLVVEQEATHRLATVRFSLSSEPRVPVIDLLFASSGIEPEVAAAADPLEVLPGLTIPVATPGHLIALKVLARDDLNRPQDLADLRALLRRVSPTELEQAREAMTLMTTRGFHRGRDLERDLADLLERR